MTERDRARIMRTLPIRIGFVDGEVGRDRSPLQAES
jgi:hypothetical protein